MKNNEREINSKFKYSEYYKRTHPLSTSIQCLRNTYGCLKNETPDLKFNGEVSYLNPFTTDLFQPKIVGRQQRKWKEIPRELIEVNV